MLYIFSIVGNILSLLIKIFSLFNNKAKSILSGRKNIIRDIRRSIDPNRKVAWFHAASLGEFEQGRPLIEEMHQRYPEYQILITFFSPSGYEVRKDYSIASVVTYLPKDNIKSTEEFLQAAKPDIVFFIKYDLWPVIIYQLRKNNIPIYLVSSIFRENQLFFKPYGKWYLNVLKQITTIFVQDNNSKSLLQKVGIDNVQICGDTRFDRVVTIAKNPKEIPAIERMITGDSKLLIVGSSWKEDEDVYMPYFNSNKNIKVVVAPHEIDNEHLLYIKNICHKSYALLSDVLNGTNTSNYDCLIIDTFGLLSSIYRYADVVYIGGGLGKGIHNTIEAAVYGKPLIFGSNNKKFREAQKLLSIGAAIQINNEKEFANAMDIIISNDENREKMGNKAYEYVRSETGVVDRILSNL